MDVENWIRDGESCTRKGENHTSDRCFAKPWLNMVQRKLGLGRRKLDLGQQMRHQAQNYLITLIMVKVLQINLHQYRVACHFLNRRLQSVQTKGVARVPYEGGGAELANELHSVCMHVV